MDERRDISRVRVPCDGELPLRDELSDALADEVNTDDRTTLEGDNLDES